MLQPVVGRDWAQVIVETGSKVGREIAKALRAAGFKVKTSSLGMQVTDVGLLKCSLVDIRCSENCDIADVFEVVRSVRVEEE